METVTETVQVDKRGSGRWDIRHALCVAVLMLVHPALIADHKKRRMMKMATEKQLIDKKSAWKTAQRIYSDPVLLHVIKNALDTTPTVDAVEVVHGRWTPNIINKCGIKHHYGFNASCCRRWSGAMTAYCPNCGAKMDGDSANG